MRVRVELIVDVDPVAWRLLYGDELTGAALREDVRAYTAAQAQDSSAADEGAIRMVELVLRRPA